MRLVVNVNLAGDDLGQLRQEAWVCRENIRLFRQGIASAADDVERARLGGLLDEQRFRFEDTQEKLRSIQSDLLKSVSVWGPRGSPSTP